MESINPYASPAVPDPPQPFAEAGVGAWRDGRLLVVHAAAALPEMCVKSGGPVSHWCEVKVVLPESGTLWPRTLWPRKLAIRLPLSARWQLLHVRGQKLLFVLGLVLAAIAVGAAASYQYVPHRMFQVLGMANLAALFISVLTGLGLRRLVEAVHARGDYVWLAGAGRNYLAKLPPWPYGK